MLFTAVCATSFAYEGWIIATTINAELKDAKKNLPRALVIGTLIVMATYVLYYIGLAGAVEHSVMMAGGEAGAKLAFANVFSNDVDNNKLTEKIYKDYENYVISHLYTQVDAIALPPSLNNGKFVFDDIIWDGKKFVKKTTDESSVY